MRKKRNKVTKMFLKRKLLTLLPLIVLISLAVFAALKFYPPFLSHAEDSATERRNASITEGWNYGDFANYLPRPGDILKGKIHIQVPIPGTVPSPTTAFQAVSVFAYDTKYYKWINGNCEWQYGCHVSSIDIASAYGSGHQMHKKRVAICFNIPANANADQTVFTWTMQRTPFSPENTTAAWYNFLRGYAEGSCESNPSAAGFVSSGATNTCNVGGYVCDDGNGPGKDDGTFTGVNGPGNGSSGTRSNGQDTGIGPSGGAGGGGSSATTQGDTSNVTPATTSQGDSTEQPKVEPSPFFDGKLFAAGSDSDGSIQENKSVSIGGLRVGYGWFYSLGLLVLIAGLVAIYFLWWRRLPLREQLSFKRKLLFKK